MRKRGQGVVLTLGPGDIGFQSSRTQAVVSWRHSSGLLTYRLSRAHGPDFGALASGKTHEPTQSDTAHSQQPGTCKGPNRLYAL